MKRLSHYISLIFQIFLFIFFTQEVFALGAFPPRKKKPDTPTRPQPPEPEPNPEPEEPTPEPEEPAPNAEEMSYHPYMDVSSDDVRISSMDLNIKPRCLKDNGLELIILDAGHDDSTASTRSDAKVRGGSGRYVILWPKVHEGRLNMLTAWITYDLLMKDPHLTQSERDELSTMIRFTRHPGESRFAQFESQEGYYSSTQGAITSGITNRRDRAQTMMLRHRKYDPNRRHFHSASTSDVRSKTAFISIHANSSEYYNEGDHTWIIPPKNTSSSSQSRILQRTMVQGMSRHFGSFYEDTTGDTRSIASLKEDLVDTVQVSRIITRQHTVNLAMLSSSLGTSRTAKLLLEGFVMNGKAGNIAKQQIADVERPKRVHFHRKGGHLYSYDYSDLYLAYAQSVAQGIADRYGCDAN